MGSSFTCRRCGWLITVIPFRNGDWLYNATYLETAPFRWTQGIVTASNRVVAVNEVLQKLGEEVESVYS